MTSTASMAGEEFAIPLGYTPDRRSARRWIFSHARRHWALWIILIGGATGNAMLAAVSPILIGQAFNAVLATPPELAVLTRLAILVAISQVSRGVLQLGRNFSSELIAQRVERDIRRELFISLLGKSMTFHSLQPVGDTMARSTNDVREVNFMFNPGLNLVLGSMIFLVMPVVAAPQYHWSLVITPVLFIIAYFIALRGYLRELSPITQEVRSAFGALNSRLAEALDGIEVVKGAAKETEEVQLFKDNAKRYRDASVKQGDAEAKFIPLLLFSISLAVGLLHALLLFRAGILDVGQVVGYFGLLLLLDFPTFTSIWAYSQISLGLASADRILELINQENNLGQNAGGYQAPMRGEVEFRDVHFGYEGRAGTLEGVSFKVKPGQTVAIVGQTGSGKTSLAKLINRTYDAASGAVLVDGVDVREWDLEALRQNISTIEQDIFLFSRTIGENIAFGRPDATEEDIQAAAEAAQADHFIDGFDGKYDSVVGERGVTLSGGQRQRLALARAFLTNPKILVLDDSTSAIDSETEDRIQRAIYAASRGRTTFIITHRLSQIRWADLILVLKNGNVAAIGAHDDLMRSSDAYRKIFTEV